MSAAETVMREEGYAAVSSRRVAEVAGVHQGLVYYYFETMDDLLVATFERRTEKAMAVYSSAADSDRPVMELWKIFNTRMDARLSFAIVALASHNERVRDIYQRFVENSRKLLSDAIMKETVARGIDISPATPASLAFLIHSSSLMMGRETALGITEGHDEVRSLLDSLRENFS